MLTATALSRAALRHNCIESILRPISVCSHTITSSSKCSTADRSFSVQLSSFRSIYRHGDNCASNKNGRNMLFPHQQRQKSDNTSANKNQTPTKKENETEETNDTIDVPVYHEFSKDDDGEDANTKRHGFPEGFDKSKFTEEVKIRMPDLGEDNARVRKWHKKEGDLIKWNDVLCDIEVESFEFGMVTDDECDAIMGPIFVPANTEKPVKDGEVLCIVLHPEEEEQK